MRKLTLALLLLLLALPLKAQTAPALSQLQQALNAAESANPGSVFEGSAIRRQSSFVVVPTGRKSVPPTPFDEPRLAQELSPETKKAAADLKEKTGPEGSVKEAIRRKDLDTETCEGFFSCMGAALVAPFTTPVVLGMAFASMGILIGAEKAGTVGMIVGGFLGGLIGFVGGFFLGVGDLVKGTFKAFGQLFRGKP